MATETKPTIHRIDKGNRRYYQVVGDPQVPEGAQLASVTTILNVMAKAGLIPWARNMSLAKVRATLYDHLESETRVIDAAWVDQIIEEARARPDEIRDEAADFGTRAHDVIERILRAEAEEEEVVVPGDLRQAIENFMTWKARAGIEIALAETMVYSAKHLYAGTMDAFGWRGGQPIALDWKTSNGLYPEAALQVSAYAKAYEEMTGQRCEAAVVRFGKTRPDFEVREVADIDASFNAFLAAQALYAGTKAAAWAKK